VTKATLREDMLVALLRPADWASFDQQSPLTFDVLGGFDCAVARVKSMTRTHLMVNVVKVVNMGTRTQSAEHAVPWPAPHETVRILVPQGVYLVPVNVLRTRITCFCFQNKTSNLIFPRQLDIFMERKNKYLQNDNILSKIIIEILK
jgi:hypothetical protein